MASKYETYHLGDFQLKNGGIIPDARIAYKTHGDPSKPAVLTLTWFSGFISETEWIIGDDKTLNLNDYYIIVAGLFGGGESSSPSNRPDLRPWPEVLFYDNVRAQHILLTQELRVTHLRAVLGWSMGAGQTYQWATQYPDFMDLVIPYCGSAKTALHNQAMLEGVKAAVLGVKGSSSAGRLTSAAGTVQWSPEEKTVALKALGRVYSGWGFSQAFWRERLYETALGFKDFEDFMVNYFEAWALSRDPDNLLAMLYTWQAGDCSAQEPYNGDFEAAMRGIKAKALVLPSATDLYFPPEDSEIEVAHMRPGIGKCVPIPSIWGHWAGGFGLNPQDVKWLDDQMRAAFRGAAT